MGNEADRDQTRPCAQPTTANARVTGTNCRRIFREMVKIEIEDRPLNWRRRRELIRFGQSMGIETFHASIIVRAIEYECGHVSRAAMDEIETPANLGYLPCPPVASDFTRFVVVLTSALLLNAIALRLLHAVLN